MWLLYKLGILKVKKEIININNTINEIEKELDKLKVMINN
jgi:cell division protein FtsL